MDLDSDVTTTFSIGSILTRLGRESVYLLISFPIWLAAFIAVVVGVATGGSLLIVVVGLPILVLTLLLARGFAEFERLSMRRLLHQEVPPGHYRPLPDDHPAAIRWISILRDPQYWLDLIAAGVMFVVSLATWTVAIIWWSVAVGGLSYPLWGWIFRTPDTESLAELLGLGFGYVGEAALYLLLGVIATLTLPLAIAAMAFVQSAISGLLLVSRSEQLEQVDQLVVSRGAARDAEAGALRRLERDIHDGPQQRLVRLTMDLGRAKKQAGTDNAALSGLLDDALTQTRDTLDELRALSRGIAPPVLADRGLRAALEEMSARSPIPVVLHIELAGPLPGHVETAVYFVVSEALTNAARHSGAGEATVSVVHTSGMSNPLHPAGTVSVRVTDNGWGGAVITEGHGLAGLGDRVRAVDGALSIDSGPGGPTVIVAEIPCG